MKVRTEFADLLVVTSNKELERHYKRKRVRVGIHPDNVDVDFETKVQEWNPALDNSIYYWFSELEFQEVQEHFDAWNKGVYVLEETTEEDTLILDVSDDYELFDIKEKRT